MFIWSNILARVLVIPLTSGMTNHHSLVGDVMTFLKAGHHVG